MFGFSPYADHFSGTRMQPRRTVQPPTLRTQRIPYECYRRGEHLVVLFALPGVQERDVEVSCSEAGVLRVEANKMVETWQPPYRAVVPMSVSVQLPRGLLDGTTEFSRGRLAVIFPVAASAQQSPEAVEQEQEQEPCQDEEPGCSSSDTAPGSEEGEEEEETAELSAEERRLIAASQRRLDAIAEAVEGIVKEHEDVAFRRTAAPEAAVEKARKYYNELLLRQTLALDEVPSHGDSETRARRKEMISGVQRLQEAVDQLVAADKM